MLKVTEVEIKKEHQVLMVKKTTSFKKKGKGKKGNFKKNVTNLVFAWLATYHSSVIVLNQMS